MIPAFFDLKSKSLKCSRGYGALGLLVEKSPIHLVGLLVLRFGGRNLTFRVSIIHETDDEESRDVVAYHKTF